MKTLDAFIAKTIKGFLIIAGLATCVPLLMAYDVEVANKLTFQGLLDYTPSSVPILRHWGMMVFGIGLLMVAAAFQPWLRFTTMVFSAVEKSFMVYLYLINSSQEWAGAYTMPFFLDATIVLYSAVYFLSGYGRSQKWVLAGAGNGDH